VLSSKRAILFVLAKCCRQQVSQSFDEHLDALLLRRRRVISLILISRIWISDLDFRRFSAIQMEEDEESAGPNRFCVWWISSGFLFTRFTRFDDE
jgi:hypothetical protein